MNFDLWCQEQAHLPIARCDKRTPEDEKTFEAYRAQIEQCEKLKVELEGFSTAQQTNINVQVGSANRFPPAR